MWSWHAKQKKWQTYQGGQRKPEQTRRRTSSPHHVSSTTGHVKYSAFGQTIPCGVLNTHVTRSHQRLHHTPHQPHSKPCHRFSRALFRRRRRRESAGEDKNMKIIHTQHGKNRLFYRPPCLPAKSEFFCQTKSHNLTPPELEARWREAQQPEGYVMTWIVW